MGRGLADLVNALFILMPVPVVIGVLFVLAMLLLPGWLFAMRTKQIKGLIRRRVRAAPDTAEELAREALAIAAGRGPLLIALGREAIRMHQRDLWNLAKEELVGFPEHAAELQELEASIGRESQPLLHPLEVLMTVRRLTELGMLDAAQARLNEAIARFPNDQELIDARAEVITALNKTQNPPDDFHSHNKDV